MLSHGARILPSTHIYTYIHIYIHLHIYIYIHLHIYIWYATIQYIIVSYIHIYIYCYVYIIYIYYIHNSYISYIYIHINIYIYIIKPHQGRSPKSAAGLFLTSSMKVPSHERMEANRMQMGSTRSIGKQHWYKNLKIKKLDKTGQAGLSCRLS